MPSPDLASGLSRPASSADPRSSSLTLPSYRGSAIALALMKEPFCFFVSVSLYLRRRVGRLKRLFPLLEAGFFYQHSEHKGPEGAPISMSFTPHSTLPFRSFTAKSHHSRRPTNIYFVR